MTALTKSYRELTPAAIILGILQGIVLNLSFVYASLKLGFSIGGSTVAAIMGYALLRGVMKKGTSIENNINQTIASGINTAGTGVVFTLPALFLLHQAGVIPNFDFNLWPFIIAGIAGSFLGVLVIIPLRKQMIELDRLRFPSGVAVTTIIRSGSSGDYSKAKLLAYGFLISATWKLMMSVGWIQEEVSFGFGVIPDYLSPFIYLSLMNFAAGLLAGKGGLPFFAGGIISWWVISPFTVNLGWVPEIDPSAQVGFIYGKMLRPLGIGVLIGGALTGTILTYPAIKSAFKSLMTATTIAGNTGDRDEMPFKALIFGAVFAIILFFISAYAIEGVTLGQAILVAIVAPIWLALAALIVAQATGMTDISPLSGMALITVTIIMFMLNNNIAAALVVGVAVCVAIGQGADMMQDLKTGFMLGARPFKQQIVQFFVTWIGVAIATGALVVLWQNGEGGQGGFGPGTALPAPQAGVLMGIIESLKTGAVPLDKYMAGGVIGGLLSLAPMSGLGVLIGLAMYLPFSITLGYGLGCLTEMWLEKKNGHSFYQHKIVPMAAGLIIGEALMGIGHALFQIMTTVN